MKKLQKFPLGKYKGKPLFLDVETKLKVGDLLYVLRYGPIMCTVCCADDIDWMFELSTSDIVFHNKKLEMQYFKDHYDVWINKTWTDEKDAEAAVG